jgi:hypothetical protein
MGIVTESEPAGSWNAKHRRIWKQSGWFQDYYRRRQQITEHQFGTLKRQHGFTHTIVRGKEKVLGEVGILFIGYNLTRCVSIIGTAELIKALRKCCLFIFTRIKRVILYA